MQAEYKRGSVIANCATCSAARSTFEFRTSSGEFGAIIRDEPHYYNGQSYSRILYILTRCANCRQGGLATVHDNGTVELGKMEAFYPVSIELANLPEGIPNGIVSEFREAELCAAHSAWRASSAMFRSALEKTLVENGYASGTLQNKVDQAAEDGIITEARRKRAHDEIRVLGNDVLHDPWHEISSEEVEASHHYAQRILEDFYDDRESVENILLNNKQIRKTE